MSTRNKFGNYQKVNDFRLAHPKYQRKRLIGFGKGKNSITLSQEGSGSRDPVRDCQMRITNSMMFKKGKINWRNLATEDSFDNEHSPRIEKHSPRMQTTNSNLSTKLR